jgi:hypothetical protein
LNFSALEHAGHDDSAHQQLPHRRSAEVYGPGTQAVLPSDLEQGLPKSHKHMVDVRKEKQMVACKVFILDHIHSKGSKLGVYPKNRF